MLYDQAQLAVAYSYAYQSTKDKKYAAIVEDILTYSLPLHLHKDVYDTKLNFIVGFTWILPSGSSTL